MKPACVVVRSLAPTAELSSLTRRLRNHAGACLVCQAELARYGRLLRQLAALIDEVEEAPLQLQAAVGQAINSGVPPVTATGRRYQPARVATAAGAAVAAAAGAVAVTVWRHSRAVV